MDLIARAVAFAEKFQQQPRAVIESALLQSLALVVLVLLAVAMVWVALRKFLAPLCNGLYSAAAAFADSGLKRKRTPAEAALCAVARQQLRR